MQTIHSQGPINSNWEALKEEMLKYSVRNSKLIDLMPSASNFLGKSCDKKGAMGEHSSPTSTSPILGNCECYEPYVRLTYGQPYTSCIEGKPYASAIDGQPYIQHGEKKKKNEVIISQKIQLKKGELEVIEQGDYVLLS